MQIFNDRMAWFPIDISIAVQNGWSIFHIYITRVWNIVESGVKHHKPNLYYTWVTGL
jgi:hypothetical protein